MLWKLRKLLIKSQAKWPVCVCECLCVCVWLGFVSVSQHLKQGAQHTVTREHTYFFAASSASSSSGRTFVNHGNYISPSTISRHASVECRKQQKKRGRRGRERKAAKEGRLIVCQTWAASLSPSADASVDGQSWFVETWISLGQKRERDGKETRAGGSINNVAQINLLNYWPRLMRNKCWKTCGEKLNKHLRLFHEIIT